MANYNFVVDSSFTPFSMQEMVMPLAMYKEAYEKDEERYLELQKQAGDFEYLSRTLPEDSQARKIYENYANDLKAQAEDFSHNGLSMKNRRALTALRGRYQGEIGRLVKADEAMREEQKLRRTMNAQDPSRLYALDNLNIDQFLDGSNPNLYNVSGTELYTRGAAAAKAASLRNVRVGDGGSTLGGYYRDWVNTKGYSAQSMVAFRENVSAIPELQQAVDAILKERGVLDNLTGVNLQRARQSVINGIIDGAVYEESHNPVRDAGVLSAQEQNTLALQALAGGYKRDENGRWVNDTDSPAYKAKQAEAISAEAQVDAMYEQDENGKWRYRNFEGYEVGPNGKLQKKKEKTKEEKEPLKESVAITNNNTKIIQKKDASGTPVSYDQLTEDEKAMVNAYHPGYANEYDYLRNSNGTLYMINNKNSVTKKGSNTSDNRTSATTQKGNNKDF